jgi:hypothetical protein
MNMQIAPCFNLGHPLANCFSFTTLRFEVATTPSRREPFVMVAFVCTPGPDADSPCTNSHGVLQSAAANQTTWTIKTRDNEVVWDVEISSAIGFEELKNVVFSTGPGTFRELDGGIEDEEGMNVGPGDGGSGFKPDIDQEPIPEPSSMLLLGSGVLGLAQVLRRKLS